MPLQVSNLACGPCFTARILWGHGALTHSREIAAHHRFSEACMLRRFALISSLASAAILLSCASDHSTAPPATPVASRWHLHRDLHSAESDRARRHFGHAQRPAPGEEYGCYAARRTAGHRTFVSGRDAVGGFQAYEETNIVEAYDPATNRWAPAKSMPTMRQSLGVGVVDGVLYAVGGACYDDTFAIVEAYVPP